MPKRSARENVLNVTLTGHAVDRLDDVLAERRQVTTNSSCGLCGRLTIDSLRANVPPLAALHVRRGADEMPERLRAAQRALR